MNGYEDVINKWKSNTQVILKRGFLIHYIEVDIKLIFINFVLQKITCIATLGTLLFTSEKIPSNSKTDSFK